MLLATLSPGTDLTKIVCTEGCHKAIHFQNWTNCQKRTSTQIYFCSVYVTTVTETNKYYL